MEDCFYKALIDKIPSDPIWAKDQKDSGMLDYVIIGEMILKKIEKVDRKFIKIFLKTQIFNYFLENFYNIT